MNTQLQERGGKNLPYFLNMFQQLSDEWKKLTTKTALIVENTDDRPLCVGEFAAGMTVFNMTTDTVDIELYYEDANGVQSLMDSTSINTQDLGGLESQLAYLLKGEKLVVKVTSVPSILSGEGLWLMVNTAYQNSPNGDEGFVTRESVGTLSVDVRALPGYTIVQGGFKISAINPSNVALTATIQIVIEGVGTITVPGTASIGAGEVANIGGTLPLPRTEVGYLKLTFSAIPAGLVLSKEYFNPANRFVQPIP